MSGKEYAFHIAEVPDISPLQLRSYSKRIWPTDLSEKERIHDGLVPTQLQLESST